MVRAFAHGAMGRRIDPSCGEPIELFLVPASAPRLDVTKAVVCAILWDYAYKRTLAVNRGGSGFPFSLSEWFLTICLTPYNRK